MFLFIQILALVFSSFTTDFSGTWGYAVNTPDGQVKGEMILTKVGDEYSGTLSAFGTASEMTNMEWKDNKLTFQTNAGGYASKISGTFDADVYTAMIEVAGYEIPLVATKQ